MNGYLYRLKNATATELEAAVQQIVLQDGTCWTFSGSIHWDIDLSNPGKNLRAISQISTNAIAQFLAGDFGHFFSPKAELRWKRRDDGGYDVLLLIEDQTQSPLVGAVPIGQSSYHIDNARHEIIQSGDTSHKPIRCYQYLATNNAVQFQRLVEVK